MKGGKSVDLAKISEGLEAKPTFTQFRFRDYNPVAGTTKIRMLHKPNPTMAVLHSRLIVAIRGLGVAMPYATGSLPGSSPRRSLRRHLKARYLYLLDIKDAYLTIDPQKMVTVLCSVDPDLQGQEDEVAAFLARYCLNEEGGLIMGAGASPDLYNLYASQLLDTPLGKLCQSYGLAISRYLDDMTISSTDENGPIGWRKRQRIRRVIDTAEFIIQPEKTQKRDLTKGPVVINGIGLKYGGETYTPRSYTRLIMALIYQVMRGEKDPALVHGRMGVFYEAMPWLKPGSRLQGPPPNRTERKVLDAYRQLQQAFPSERQRRRSQRR